MVVLSSGIRDVRDRFEVSSSPISHGESLFIYHYSGRADVKTTRTRAAGRSRQFKWADEELVMRADSNSSTHREHGPW